MSRPPNQILKYIDIRFNGKDADPKFSLFQKHCSLAEVGHRWSTQNATIAERNSKPGKNIRLSASSLRGSQLNGVLVFSFRSAAKAPQTLFVRSVNSLSRSMENQVPVSVALFRPPSSVPSVKGMYEKLKIFTNYFFLEKFHWFFGDGADRRRDAIMDLL